MSYLIDNFARSSALTRTHLYLALVPLLHRSGDRGARRHRGARNALAAPDHLTLVEPGVHDSRRSHCSSPSRRWSGLQILDPLNVVIALTVYSTALLLIAPCRRHLIRCPPSVIDSADRDGLHAAATRAHRRMPLALPVFIANIRVVAVTNISLVSVGSLIGIGGLGKLFTQGYQRDYPDQILAGIIAIAGAGADLRSRCVPARHARYPVDPRRRARDAEGCARVNLFGEAWNYRERRRQLGRAHRHRNLACSQHLWYSFLAVALSAVIAVPLGLLIGHLRRGAAVLVGFVNALRSLPTLGLLTFLVLLPRARADPADLALVTARHPAAAGGRVRGDRERRPPMWSTPRGRWG